MISSASTLQKPGQAQELPSPPNDSVNTLWDLLSWGAALANVSRLRAGTTGALGCSRGKCASTVSRLKEYCNVIAGLTCDSQYPKQNKLKHRHGHGHGHGPRSGPVWLPATIDPPKSCAPLLFIAKRAPPKAQIHRLHELHFRSRIVESP